MALLPRSPNGIFRDDQQPVVAGLDSTRRESALVVRPRSLARAGSPRLDCLVSQSGGGATTMCSALPPVSQGFQKTVVRGRLAAFSSSKRMPESDRAQGSRATLPSNAPSRPRAISFGGSRSPGSGTGAQCPPLGGRRASAKATAWEYLTVLMIALLIRLSMTQRCPVDP